MTWILEHWFVLLLFAIYSALLVHHAIVGKRRTHDTADYYVGGRTMGGVAIGISFFATYSSTNSFVGFSGQAYSYGTPWLLLTPAVVIFCFIAWRWVAPRLREFTASTGSVTLPDFIGFRFDSNPARMLGAAIILFASFLYMTAIFKGIGNLLAIFLGIPYGVSILVVFVIVMAYTAVGGFISVVRTDVVQGMIMVFAAIVLFMGTTRAAGGMGSFFEVARQPATASLFSWNGAMPFPVLLGVIVAGTLKFIVEPRQLSRFYALEDRRAIHRGMWVATLTFLFVYSMLLPIGIYAHNIIPVVLEDTDLVVPTLISGGSVFSSPVGAFLLVAMVAAAMSSLDSVLLVMASTCERDIVSLLRPPSSERSVVSATRFYVGLFALVTALLALNPPGQIVTLTAFSGSLYAACFFPSIILGLHWRRGTGTAVIASYVAGIATLLLWQYTPYASVIHRVFPALLLSVLSYVVISLVAQPNRSDAVEALFWV
ncbi:MAG: sodium:solute symporter [Gemmatimonadales bacterium]